MTDHTNPIVSLSSNFTPSTSTFTKSTVRKENRGSGEGLSLTILGQNTLARGQLGFGSKRASGDCKGATRVIYPPTDGSNFCGCTTLHFFYLILN